MFVVFKGAVRMRLGSLSIVSTAMHLLHATHARHLKLSKVLVDKGVLHSWCLTKYTAAFFKMSRSSVVRFKDAFKRRTTCLKAATSILTAGCFCNSASLIHL